MQLTFLGVRYQANLSSLPVLKGRICGKYRGQFWFKNHLKDKLTSQPAYRLKYRGVEYISAVYIRGENTSVTVASKLNLQTIHPSQATFGTSESSLQRYHQKLTDSATSSESNYST
jgi:Domain of unknown function (DUF4278)